MNTKPVAQKHPKTATLQPAKPAPFQAYKSAIPNTNQPAKTKPPWYASRNVYTTPCRASNRPGAEDAFAMPSLSGWTPPKP